MRPGIATAVLAALLAGPASGDEGEKSRCVLLAGSRIPAVPGLTVQTVAVDIISPSPQLTYEQLMGRGLNIYKAADEMFSPLAMRYEDFKKIDNYAKSGNVADAAKVLLEAINSRRPEVYRGRLDLRLGNRDIGYGFECWFVDGRALMPLLITGVAD